MRWTGSGATFGRSCRLCAAQDFSSVFSGRKSLRGKLFVLHYRKNPQAEARLGLVIPKKQARTAVLRNAIKRQARETFRLRRPDLPGLDLVLRLAQPVRPDRQAAVVSRSVWREEIGSLLDGLARMTDKSLP